MQPEIDRRGAYAEPFVGSAAVTQHVKCPLRQAHDANHAVVTLWQAVSQGWQPPDCLSKAEYDNLRHLQDPLNPMTAFAGIGCSFSGKWFGGFARSENRNYAANARNSILKKAKGLTGVEWSHGDFASVPLYEGAVVYCDPPYAGTTSYTGTPAFDHTRFWAWCREAEKDGFCVYVSEYAAPPDFACVWQIETKTDMRMKSGAKDVRIEKLFRWSSGDRHG